MRIFKPKYRDRATGKLREAQKFYIDFTDHLQVRHRIPAPKARTKAQAEAFGRKVEDLTINCHHGEKPDAATDTWLRGLPKSALNKLADIGLIDCRYVTATTPLSAHVKDFETWLRTTVSPRYGRKRSPRYCNLLMQQLRAMLRDCGFRTWADIDKSRVEMYLGGLRDKVGQRTYNAYVTAIKTFASWMVNEANRAAASPVEKLKIVKVRDTKQRRALDADELCTLIEATVRGPARYGTTGLDRAVAYLLAVELGFRVRELRSLRIRDFDFAENRPDAFRTPAVRLAAEFCKNREPAEQALRRTRAEQLRRHFADKDPGDKALNVPPSNRTADMFRADLRHAGIEIEDAAGRTAVFHSLRHTLATALDRSGVSLKTAMSVMRHSTRGNLTLGVYTDEVTLLEKREAVEKLPDYPWPGQTQQKDGEMVA